MPANVGVSDRWIRVILGIVFAVLAIMGIGGTVGVIVFAILAVVGIGTGLTTRCPLYAAVHCSTRPKV